MHSVQVDEVVLWMSHMQIMFEKPSLNCQSIDNVQHAIYIFAFSEKRKRTPKYLFASMQSICFGVMFWMK